MKTGVAAACRSVQQKKRVAYSMSPSDAAPRMGSRGYRREVYEGPWEQSCFLPTACHPKAALHDSPKSGVLDWRKKKLVHVLEIFLRYRQVGVSSKLAPESSHLCAWPVSMKDCRCEDVMPQEVGPCHGNSKRGMGFGGDARSPPPST